MTCEVTYSREKESPVRMGKRKDNVLTLCEELTKAPDDLIYLVKV